MNRDLRGELDWYIGLVADEFMRRKKEVDCLQDKRRASQLVKRWAGELLEKIVAILEQEEVSFDRINVTPDTSELGYVTVKRDGQEILRVSF
ncbi:MAG: hypothetical protein ABH822_00075 [Patescibacteria group bacterium]